jgi:hypothetical protein
MCSAATYLRPHIVRLALQLHGERRSRQPESDWSTLERQLLSSTQEDKQADLIEKYRTARGAVLAGRLPTARALLREAAVHPGLQRKARLMLALTALPLAPQFLAGLLRLSARRDPFARYVRELTTAS